MAGNFSQQRRSSSKDGSSVTEPFEHRKSEAFIKGWENNQLSPLKKLIDFRRRKPAAFKRFYSWVAMICQTENFEGLSGKRTTEEVNGGVQMFMFIGVANNEYVVTRI